MNVISSIPTRTASDHIEVLASPECEGEVWVIPGDELGLLDLPRVRELLPPELANAQLLGFVPLDNLNGGWVLSVAA